ncbi:WxL domain-containing protein [Carnobacterium maltaromaticum]|uniref:WxL domain-containing protein n=1 Tax=Carnobacterium maltaromaticum TaxID=2751 RepID=A0AAW9K7T5_CARML|nr:WxL domain-containing protein [Carnobacterium maltaromaticum]MDZ5760711.1 WxL domain-containing protein [Carnobacterium maltaromaticum]
MKKMTLIAILSLTTITLTGMQAQAAVSSTGHSENKINFTAGDNEVTEPIDPTDPDNPNPPNPIDPADPDNPGTGEEGPLSIDYVSNIKFGEHKISGKNISYKAINQNPFVQVTDTRGFGEGWSLSAKISKFKNGNKVLQGATLSMVNGIVKSGSTSNISKPPVNYDIIFDNEESKLVLSAKDKAGRGTWLNVWSGANKANEAIQLNVLAGTAEANTEYSSSITWELEDAPK